MSGLKVPQNREASKSTPTSVHHPWPSRSGAHPAHASEDFRSLHFDRSPSRSALLSHREESSRRSAASAINEVDEKKRKEDEETARLKEAEKWKHLDAKEKTKRAQNRLKVIEEIVSTEKTYVLTLTILQTHYVTPLLAPAACKQYSLTPQCIHQLCNNLETLSKFHHQFIAELSSSASTKLAQTFIVYADLFKLYTCYVNEYEKMLMTIQAHKNNNKFNAFLADFKKKATTTSPTPSTSNAQQQQPLAAEASPDLLSFLICPVQRLPRYILLLSSLISCTPPDHADYQLLCLARSKLSAVATHVNEMKKKAEMMMKILSIEQRMEEAGGGTTTNSNSKDDAEKKQLMQPHRRYIREGSYAEVCHVGLFNSVKLKQRVWILFNDLLLWTKDTGRYKGTMDLVAADVQMKENNTMQLSTSKQTVSIQFAAQAEAEDWQNVIQDCIRACQEDRNAAAKRIRINKARTKNGTLHSEKDALHALISEGLRDVSLRDEGELEDDIKQKKEEEQKEQAEQEQRQKQEQQQKAVIQQKLVNQNNTHTHIQQIGAGQTKPPLPIAPPVHKYVPRQLPSRNS